MKLAGQVKKVLLIVTSLLLVSLIVSCSAPAPAPAERTAKSSGMSGAPANQSTAGGSAPAVAPAAPAASTDATSAYNKEAAAQGGAAAPWDRMIIRTVNLSLTVKDVEACIAALRDIADSAGGFVSQSNTRYDGENQLATITIQVPTGSFDGAVAAARQLAVKVDSETGNSQDVTEEFTDLDAQVRNLQATEASLQRLMDKATRIEDIIALQRELTNVRGEIEKRQGRMKFLSRRAEMSTITISLRPQALASQQPPTSEWRPFQTARRAWEASTKALAVVADVVIALVVFLWWLLPLVVLGWYIWRSRRAQRRAEASPR